MKIAVNSLQPGMIFSEPVYIEEDNILVPAGVALRQKDLDRLVSWGIDAVETNGQPVSAEQMAEKLKIIAQEKAVAENEPQKNENKDANQAKKDDNAASLEDDEENSGVYRSYLDLIEKLDQIFTNIGDGADVEVRAINAISVQVLKVLRDHRNILIGYILGGKVTGQELAKSSVNTAILSAYIASELKLPNHRIMQIITGALLHDVGMIRLPRELVHKKGGLSPAEIEKMQMHPLYAYGIVTKELQYPEEVGLVTFQHHERWDGDGYPGLLAGADIDMGARIVSVADAFEAMVSHKPYRNSMVGYEAMKNLLSDNSRRFDPEVLKAFIRTMGIYPIGSFIQLNNGAMARVTDVQGLAPLRPRVQIIIDENGKTYKKNEGAYIDLLSDKRYFIARAVDPKEISQKNA